MILAGIIFNVNAITVNHFYITFFERFEMIASIFLSI